MVKELLLFAFGGGIGFGIGYIIFDKRAKKKAEEEIASVKEYAKRRIEAMKNETTKNGIDLDKIREAFSESHEDDEEEEETDTDDLDRSDNVRVRQAAEDSQKIALTGPVEIGPDDFGEVLVNDQVMLLYYVDNDVLVTEDEEIIDNPIEILGDVLEESGFTEDNRINLYVRNMLLGTDYEITKVFASYEGEL